MKNNDNLNSIDKRYSSEFIESIHKSNFKCLVDNTTSAERALFAAYEKRTTLSADTNRVNISPQCHDDEANEIQPKFLRPSRRCKGQTANSNIDFCKTLKHSLSQHVLSLAKSLIAFQRAVCIKNGNETDYTEVVVEPNIRRYEMLRLLALGFMDHQSQDIYQDEFSHTNAFHVYNVTARALFLLQLWRKTLEKGDQICATSLICHAEMYRVNKDDCGWFNFYDADIVIAAKSIHEKDLLEIVAKNYNNCQTSISHQFRTLDLHRTNKYITSLSKPSSKAEVHGTKITMFDYFAGKTVEHEVREEEVAFFVRYKTPKIKESWSVAGQGFIADTILPNGIDSLKFRATNSLQKNLKEMEENDDRNTVQRHNVTKNGINMSIQSIMNLSMDEKAQNDHRNDDWKDSENIGIFALINCEAQFCDEYGHDKIPFQEIFRNKMQDFIASGRPEILMKERYEKLKNIMCDSSQMLLGTRTIFQDAKFRNGSELQPPIKQENKDICGLQTDNNRIDIKEESHNQRKRKRIENKNKDKDKEDKNLEFTWICTECREAECITDPNSPLLVCEGICNRPFHYPCAGLGEVPPEDEEWICSDCQQRRHQCAVCHEYGLDDIDIFKCDKKECGLFFHEACLTMYDVDIEVTEQSSAMLLPIDELKEDVENSSRKKSCASIESDKECFEKSQEKLRTQKSLQSMSKVKFVCPAHSCWTCSGGIPLDPNQQPIPEVLNFKKSKKKKKKKASENLSSMFSMKKDSSLYKCLECPNSYHITCIPPAARFHEIALLCHEHAQTSKLPHLDMSTSYQAQVEAEADRTIDALRKQGKKKKRIEDSGKDADRMKKEPQNKFLPGMRGDIVTDERTKYIQLFDYDNKFRYRMLKTSGVINFCLPCDIQQEVHSKPPSYKHIHINKFDPKHRPRRHPPSHEVCQCVIPDNKETVACDDHCLNRMAGIECVGDSSTKSGDKNPYWNCNLGPECGNRMLSRRQFAKCRPQREKGKGWGLVCLNLVQKGGLVQEYVGEIIDEATKTSRLNLWAQDHPNDPNFYVMHLEPGWFIDAREKGSLSRFINHSCDPNCKLVPTIIAGLSRVAIVALCDIQPGEFLNYDYQFDTKYGDKFICRCGAEKCRGTMKGGTNLPNVDNLDEIKQKTKKDLWVQAKCKFEKDKKFLKDIKTSEYNRLYQVGQYLPGERIQDNAHLVASGPQKRSFINIRETHVCLWRNVMKGSDFSSRYSRILKSGMKRNLPTQQSLDINEKLKKIDVLSYLEKPSNNN
eukprot:CAMPEP_0184861972 /NCGR_PEP_ID=MMETSP0580-20130426/6530_1 /TAXON_ID=1118495 /ORGANISM="Dactyliosolen fragilissimus" /LENGTH=1262 /DNA_ID=CAMNT_0027359655 /DNA_START=318 /DNA_END=4106 /DNA_ORIENTATION=-